ncbi:hypothetical protein BDP27DRAFT_1423147 [Rhodocollybia butyracea]|uniref:Uncharacterized protein n=1 Tax=Rhodocollybia butyracea TaxID=206335 RepID=A0A9P5PPI9_9AGAR|nr:hypothetical protein BDP27DRAFT_1423147 [Rhodocollybia butyracea]
MKLTAIFALAAALLFSAAVHVGAAATPVVTARDSLPTLFNGQNISFKYPDIMVTTSLFGMGCVTLGQTTPSSILDANKWEGTMVLGFFDYDNVNATYVLQFPFFNPGAEYTVLMFECDTSTGAVIRPNLKTQSFIWINRPGQSD